MGVEASDHHWGHRSAQLAPRLTLLCAKRVGTLLRSRTMAGRHQLSAHRLPGDLFLLGSAAQDPRGEGPSWPSSCWLGMCGHFLWHLHTAPRSPCMSGEGCPALCPLRCWRWAGSRGGWGRDVPASSTLHVLGSPFIFLRGALQPVGCLGAQRLETHYTV